jgi:hypothetical protein
MATAGEEGACTQDSLVREPAHALLDLSCYVHRPLASAAPGRRGAAASGPARARPPAARLAPRSDARPVDFGSERATTSVHVRAILSYPLRAKNTVASKGDFSVAARTRLHEVENLDAPKIVKDINCVTRKLPSLNPISGRFRILDTNIPFFVDVSR